MAHAPGSPASSPAPSPTHTFPLTALRMRLTCAPETPVHLEGLRAGTLLRGALLSVMLRTTCALTGVPYERRKEVDSEHVATCPVCWLIQANEQPGNERRGYLITPPLPPAETYLPGQPFTFHITLLGKAVTYIPYFIISSHEMGRTGVGKGRGRPAACAALPRSGRLRVGVLCGPSGGRKGAEGSLRPPP
ncbi:hypothetical protein [Spirochaeta thermophila]|nr:hypothetical protein [Spirochaeta thermophila]